MTNTRDPDRLIAAFLSEGQTELPDRAYDEVRGQIDRARQRMVVGPWAMPSISTVARVAVAAVLVLGIALGAENLLPDQRGIGGPEPTPTATASPVLLPPIGDLDPGTYRIERTGVTTVPFALAIPAGWSTINYAILGIPDDQLFRVAVSPWVVESVYADACHWRDGLSEPRPGPTVAGLARVLAAQGSRVSTARTDVTVGGYAGEMVEFSIPDDLDIDACDDATLRMWPDVDGGEGGYHYGPGQRDRVYIVDVDGARFVLHAMWLPSASADELAALESVIDSIRFYP